MRTWLTSACVVLTCTLLAVLVMAGRNGPARPAQANTRTAISITHEVILTRTLTPAISQTAAARPAARYVIQPGDTLSAIAARFAVRGGWPALYAANRDRIGPEPGTIRPGTILTLPGVQALTRYRVAAGDTLSGIAAQFAIRGGWPALYAANRDRIGPDPDAIRPGMVLTLAPPPSAAPAPSPGGPARPRPAPSPAPSAPVGAGPSPRPATNPAPAVTGMPHWLKTLLVAVGVLILAAFLTEPVLATRRRRHQAANQALPPARAETSQEPSPRPVGQVPGPRPPVTKGTRTILADYDRLVVTHNKDDGMVYVLRPPGADPGAILRVARLVLPEGPYRELAGHLGMPASWPVVLADHDRLVVTRNQGDGTVCVLRPPGEDPKAILRAARLVLPEGLYGELAEQLGVAAGWPME
jgi:LysM repeat protein